MKNITIAAILGACMAIPTVASAQGYLGLAAGQNKIDISGAKESTAFAVFGGYAFNEYAAGELAYTDFGSADTATPGASLKGNAASLAVVGSLPLGKDFSLYAKLGYASTKIEVLSVSQTKSDATYGIGAQYNLSKSIGLRLEYDNYKVGDTNTKDSALTSLGILYKF